LSFFRGNNEIAALDSQIAEMEVSLEPVLDHPKKKEKIHAQIAKLRERREELLVERPLLDRAVVDAKAQERAAEINHYLSRRQDLHQQGQEIAKEIVTVCAQLSKSFQRWKELHREDRRCVDILRSLDASKMNTLPTFSWTTCVDASMEVALAGIATEGQRAATELHKRTRTT
jgi:chromosome segregation ATPase